MFFHAAARKKRRGGCVPEDVFPRNKGRLGEAFMLGEVSMQSLCQSLYIQKKRYIDLQKGKKMCLREKISTENATADKVNPQSFR